LLDIGVHLLDLALFTMDNFRPVSVSGCTYSRFGHRGLGEGGWGFSDRSDVAFDVDDFATALVRFDNGASLTLDASWALHQSESDRQNVVIHGSEAGAGCYPAELYSFGAAGEQYQVTRAPALPLPYAHESAFHNFVNAVLGREPLCVTTAQALTVQRILDAIYQSSESGNDVRLTID
jgi:predicted dehydrogenase